MFSCDYNGWADVPEDEREGIDAFEASAQVPTMPLLPLVFRLPTEVLPMNPGLKAA